MKLKILILLTTIAGITAAQSAGNSGLSFLKFGFGARNIAMGDFGAAGLNDLTALRYNPAQLAGYNKTELMFTHNELIQDVRSEMFAAGFNFLGLPWAAGVNTTTVSDIEVREKPGEALTTFNANFFVISLSTGFYLYEGLAAGASIKYIYEGIYVDNSTGIGYDFGLTYKAPIENLIFGASINNLGSMGDLRNKPTQLPTDLRIGASWLYPLENIKSDLTLIGGFQKYTPAEENHFHLGFELFYDDLIALRGGYVSGYESKDFTAGVGFLWSGINFDYAMMPFYDDLGLGHTISLRYTF